jgi:serine/threonine protein kinase
MSFLTESPFLVLDAQESGELARGAAGVAPIPFNFTEYRPEPPHTPSRTIVRQYNGFDISISKTFIKKKGSELEQKMFRNEGDVVDFLNHVYSQDTFSKEVNWVNLKKYLIIPNRPSSVGNGIQINQSFAGIDLEDFFEKILPNCEGDYHLRPEVHLLVWRGVIAALHVMHQVGMVHGDAKPDNFCINTSGKWSKETVNTPGTFRGLDFSNIKIIDLGLTLLPSEFRVSQADKIAADMSGTELDDAVILAANAKHDFAKLSKYIVEYNTNYLSHYVDDGTSQFNRAIIKEILDKLPNELNQVTGNNCLHYDTIIANIDNAFAGIDTSFSFMKKKSVDVDITADDKHNNGTRDSSSATNKTSATLPPDIPPIPSPSIPPKKSLIPAVAASAAVIALAAGGWYAIQSKPASSVAASSPAILAKKGVIAESDPVFIACTAQLGVLANIIEGKQALDAANKKLLESGLLACEQLLPRQAPAHEQLFRTHLAAGYYKLVLGDWDAASKIADELLINYTEYFRSPLFRAAIRAKRGDEAGFLADLTLALQKGLPRSELDDESRLYGDFAKSSAYLAIRSRAKK